MTGIGLNIGLKALLSARTVLDTIGHNVANANTPGYTRQRVGLSNSIALPRGPHWIGSGVDMSGVRREIDGLLNRRILGQRAVQGALGTRLDTLEQLESFLSSSEAGTFGGLLDGFFDAVSSLSTAPGDRVLRTGLVQAADSVASRLGELGTRGGLAARDVKEQLDATVADVNRLASGIARLNVQVSSATTRGGAPNDLLDRRDRLVDEMSELVDVTTIEAADGAVGVLVSGNMLVSSSRAVEMESVLDANGDARVRLAGSQGFVPVRGGKLGGLLELAHGDLPALQDELDAFTRQLVLATNRIHSIGRPTDGPFTELTGAHRLQDQDQDGRVTDELLSDAGLPFDVRDGSLWLNVEDLATGEVTKSRIDVRATHTTVQDLIDAIDALDHVSAGLDGGNRLRIAAAAGHGFDFTPRVEPYPDAIGSFGGSRASLATGTPGPYAVADGDTLTITGDPGGAPSTFTVTFDVDDFVEISNATAEEIAAVVNADPGAAASGITAASVAGELVLQTSSSGTAADLRVDGGTAVGALGLAGHVGVVVTGQQQSVDAELKGAYTGPEDETLVFRPTSDGSIGTTPGLSIEVRDASGTLVTTLDVGAGYVPGTELEVVDGVTVSFGLGDLSSTNGDVFEASLVAEPDSADVLGALGLNALFVLGEDGGVSVRGDLLASPERLSTSYTGASGDSQLLLDVLAMKDDSQAELDGASLDQAYGGIVGDLGFRVASTTGALEVGDSVLQDLELRRDQVSGVDVDEELVDMVAFEQAYQAATRYISVISQLSDELLALL